MPHRENRARSFLETERLTANKSHQLFISRRALTVSRMDLDLYSRDDGWPFGPRAGRNRQFLTASIAALTARVSDVLRSSTSMARPSVVTVTMRRTVDALRERAGGQSTHWGGVVLCWDLPSPAVRKNPLPAEARDCFRSFASGGDIGRCTSISDAGVDNLGVFRWFRRNLVNAAGRGYRSEWRCAFDSLELPDRGTICSRGSAEPGKLVC